MINYIGEQKVTALILRRTLNVFKLLGFTFEGRTYPYYRFPGGGVEENETIEEAMYREILEESGITKDELLFMRKIGELKYYKPITAKKVHMHQFLLMYNGNQQEDFTYLVTGNGKDQGTTYHYTWLSKDDIYKMDPELSQLINTYHLPEFYIHPNDFGLRKNEIQLVHTNSEWRRMYEYEEIQIRDKINHVTIHHIGSTSISEFIAKPIIDLLLVFKNKEDLLNIIQSLQLLGYTYKGENGIENRHYFTKGTIDTTYFHLHAYLEGNQAIHDHLKVIHVLQNNIDYKQRYYQYKINNQHRTREDYTNDKYIIMNEIISL